jgi:hypothetical protein
MFVLDAKPFVVKVKLNMSPTLDMDYSRLSATFPAKVTLW